MGVPSDPYYSVYCLLIAMFIVGYSCAPSSDGPSRSAASLDSGGNLFCSHVR